MLKKTIIDGKVCYFFESRFFEYENEQFEIICSREGVDKFGRPSRHHMDAVHSIRRVGETETADRIMRDLVAKLSKK